MPRVDWRSLRFRLFTWLCGVAVVVVGVTWLLHGSLLSDLAREFLGERLRQEAEYTLRRLQEEGPSALAWLEATSETYQLFHHLYAVRLNGIVTVSDPLWREQLEPYLSSGGDSLFDVEWRGRQLLVYREVFAFDGQRGVLLIGEDFSQVESGLATLHWWVAGIAGVVLLLLVTLNLIAVSRGLRPLTQLHDQLHELQWGRRDRIQLDAPSELDDLVVQLNQFLDDQDRRLARSRESVANLSHGLKTPLAAVTQVLRGSRPIDDKRRQKMLKRLEDIYAQLESELRRSRFATGAYAGQVTIVRREAEQLIDMFDTLYPETCFQLDADLGMAVSVPVERQDFMEMLGVVLDNAGKWATEEVHCRLAVSGTALSVTVEDDGPGVGADKLEQLGQRGVRLDEGVPGHGLGLSILGELVHACNGSVDFQHSPLGGLKVVTIFPLA
ncbi:sensor histidine kinase [Halomonas faecis]|uniref:sensor histidine kinase n=1 Tax=Halomonas faecis TaxID=1562110 RepID=UPI001F096CC9|nr:sensor histidine kinase [Halomonas faecis]